jgi:hypothetical protein
VANLGGSLIEHPQALAALRDLVTALWHTHQFMVDGDPVGSIDAVIEAFRQDRSVMFVPIGS